MTYHDVGGLRARLGLSRHDLARRIGVSLNKLDLWERGIKVPSATENLLIKHLVESTVTPLKTADEMKAARVALGMTQGAMAERLGVHLISVCRWEKGRRQFSRHIGMTVALMVQEKARSEAG